MAIISSEIVRAARAMLGIKQEELARLAGISTPTLRKIENGDKMIAVFYIERVQRALEIEGLEFIRESEHAGEGLRWRAKQSHV